MYEPISWFALECGVRCGVLCPYCPQVAGKMLKTMIKPNTDLTCLQWLLDALLKTSSSHLIHTRKVLKLGWVRLTLTSLQETCTIFEHIVTTRAELFLLENATKLYRWMCDRWMDAVCSHDHSHSNVLSAIVCLALSVPLSGCPPSHQRSHSPIYLSHREHTATTATLRLFVWP